MKLQNAIQEYLKNKDPILRERIGKYINYNEIQDEDWECLSLLCLKAVHSDLRLLAFLACLKSNAGIEQLCQILGLNEIVKPFLRAGNFRKVQFPVTGNGDSDRICVAIVMPLADLERGICLCKGQEKDAQALYEALGTGFIAGFNLDIQGNSWMLAVAAGVFAESNVQLHNLAFSGIVESSGRIISAADIEQKSKLTQASGLRLIHNSIPSVESLKYWLNERNIPIPIIQYSGQKGLASLALKKMESSIQQDFPLFNVIALKEWFGIEEDDLCIFQEDNIEFEPGAWRTILLEAKAGFDALDIALQPRKAIVWYAGKLSSLQFGIGVSYGFNRPVCICQYEPGDQSYLPVIRLFGQQHPRALKRILTDLFDLKYLSHEIEYTPDATDLKLIIFLGSHNLVSVVKQVDTGSPCDHLIIRAKHDQGFIDFESDWMQIVQEINSILNYYKNSHSWRNVHIFQTCPTSICFALGIAFGQVLPYRIWHYQPDGGVGTYKYLYQLDTIFI